MSTDKEVATRANSGQVATINQRAFAGKGTEEINQDDISTPILKILHQLSPAPSPHAPNTLCAPPTAPAASFPRTPSSPFLSLPPALSLQPSSEDRQA